MADHFRYLPDGDILSRFFLSRASVSIIQGPIGCLDGETEFLSPDGWVRMDSWSGEEVATWGDGVLTFEKPLGYVGLPAEQMWRFSNQHSLDMVVSDGHRVPLYDRNGQFRVRFGGEVAAAPGRYTVPIGFHQDGVSVSESRLRLQVAINADGCFPKRGNHCVVTVRKDRKKVRIRELLAANGVEWKEHQHSTRETELTFAFSRDGWQKRLPTEWYRLPSESLAVVMDEVTFWDGLHDHDELRYYTTSKADADLVQFAAHANGRRASIGKIENETWADNYTVHITCEGSPKGVVGIRKDWMSIEEHPCSHMYCFTTRTGFFLARRSGRIFVTGNSGTSTACMHKLWAIALQQAPGPDKVRRTRMVIIRNTYADLRDTTMKTWSYWFEEMVGGSLGEVMMTKPPRHRIQVPHPDGKTRVDCEVIFLALDVEEDKRRLMSQEPTVYFFNEMQFTEKAIFDEAQSRVALGRYPPKLEGGPTFHGVIGDLNAPTEGHWIPYMRGDVPLPLEWDEEKRAEYAKPDGWEFFIQPPGLIEVMENGRLVGYEENTEAENRKWLSQPYTEAIKGKSRAWINERVMNRVGLYRSGKPVFETFRPEFHVADKPIPADDKFPLIVGLDFARNPAAIFCQNIRGQFQALDELGMENVSAATYAPAVRQRIAEKYPWCMAPDGPGVQFWGDPTGDSKGQGTDFTPFQIFLKHGMSVMAAPGNNSVALRINTIDTMLGQLAPAGGPKLIISPTCVTLKTAMAGGYHYKKIQGQNRHHDQPHKDHFADYADGLQYAALGAGFGVETIDAPANISNKPTRTRKRRFSLKRR